MFADMAANLDAGLSRETANTTLLNCFHNLRSGEGDSGALLYSSVQ